MSQIKLVTPADLKTRILNNDMMTIIDVREEEEIAQGIISSAIHIPMGEIPDRIADIPRNHDVIFVCRSGARSGRVCEYLQIQGFQNVINLDGGMLEWDSQ